MLVNFLSLLLRLSVSIAGSKHVQRNREEFVVDPSRVEGESSHHKEQVPHGVYIRQEFSGFLIPDEPNRKSQNNTAVADITKHDSKEEREDGYSEKCGVDFLISRDTISVDDLLEWCSELIHFEVCRWFLVRNRLSDRNSRRQ